MEECIIELERGTKEAITLSVNDEALQIGITTYLLASDYIPRAYSDGYLTPDEHENIVQLALAVREGIPIEDIIPVINSQPIEDFYNGVLANANYSVDTLKRECSSDFIERLETVAKEPLLGF